MLVQQNKQISENNTFAPCHNTLLLTLRNCYRYAKFANKQRNTVTRSKVNDFHTLGLQKFKEILLGKAAEKKINDVVLLMFDFTYHRQTSITCKQRKGYSSMAGLGLTNSNSMVLRQLSLCHPAMTQKYVALLLVISER